MITLMSFLVAAGDYSDVFPGGWRMPPEFGLSLMSFLAAARGDPDVFPAGSW